MITKGSKVKFTLRYQGFKKDGYIHFTGRVKEIKKKNFTDYVIDKKSLTCHDDIIKREVQEIK